MNGKQHKYTWTAAAVGLGICLTVPLAAGIDGQRSSTSHDQNVVDIARLLAEVLPADDVRGVIAPINADGTVLVDPGDNHGGGGILLGGHSLGLIAAANNILDLQCPNGGFDWPYECTSSSVCNITAPITMGLLRAYATTGDPAYLDATIDGGNHDLGCTWPVSGKVAFASFDPAWLWILSDVTGDPTWADTAKADFFDRLTDGIYGDGPASCGGTDWFPGTTHDWIGRHKCLRSGNNINMRAWDLQYMPWVAGLIGNPDSAPGDGIHQQEAFTDALLDALNVLERDLQVDLLGLAGGVRGLALAGQSSFPAIDSDDFPEIDGIDNLCDLADVLPSFQNNDGSWSWRADLQNAGGTAPDTQTTSYAVLALLAAQDLGCGSYQSAIDDARDWLWTMQDGSDGAFLQYPGGPKFNQIQGDALMALATSTDVSLVSDVCSDGGAQSITVDINMSDMPGIEIVGGQFRLQYDTDTLSNPVIAAGDAPFTVLISDDIDTTAGTIFVAVGVPTPPGNGTDQATTMARITFDAAEDCTVEDLVTFRPDDPPFFTRLTDGFGNAVYPPLTDLHPVTIDGTAPTIDAPADIQVYADAGTCEATVDLFNTQVETFDTNPDLNVWIVDRRAPHCFESTVFDGDNRLKHCIHEDDAAGGSGFNNTQGRKKDLDPAVWSMSVDLYVPLDWATSDRRMAGLWGEGHVAGSGNTFAIIEFTSGTQGYESTSDDPANAGSPDPRFRAWASGIGWVDMGLPTGFTYDGWHTLTISLTGSEYVFEVGDLSLTLPASGAQEIDWAFLQGYNTHTAFTSGVTYDIHWDNFTVQEMPAIVSDNCDPNPAITATRDDNEPLDAPYPSGTTVITWTATDACGNSTDEFQTVEVISDNQMIADVSIEGLSSVPSLERCITFELIPAGGGTPVVVQQTVELINGEALGVVVDVPCGDYECITARDPLHTLANTGDINVDGTLYVADNFGDLLQGDLNDDGLVDILDFGVFVFQFGVSYGFIDTPCGTPAPHADMSGSGDVATADFTFISNNFLEVDQMCPGTMMAGMRGIGVRPKPTPQPRTQISVRELHRMGLGHLAVADLTGDGWVGPQDIAAFASGVRPN